MVDLINHASNSIFRKNPTRRVFLNPVTYGEQAPAKPAVQLLQIQKVHPVAHSSACNFCLFFIYFSYLFYLGHLLLLGLQEDRVTLLFSARSSPTTQRHSWAPWQALLCMLLASAHRKCLAQKVVRFGSPGWIPMIRAPFSSSCVALQYDWKVFHRVVPEVHGIENQKISVQPRGIFYILKVYSLPKNKS